ncbi:MAG TPA: aminodeoxychorismate synthase component I [Chitinophagaceae bacterium]|nr:aminodeoxychorismate synthase component I [Chitinophagaceae bacterium]
MQNRNKHQALIEKINEFGKHGIPFFLIVDFSMQYPRLFNLDELINNKIQVDFPTYKTPNLIQIISPIELIKNPITFEDYQYKFNVVKENLNYGNSFLTNLTCETPIETKASLSEIFTASHAKYKIQFGDEWVCFSPESFIKIEDQAIHSYPMKGTIDASIDNARNILENDKKEIAEHYTIVDLIRNDMSMVATNVQVKKFRYIDELKTSDKTLLQVSSHIQGELPINFQSELGNILFSLLPAGSISGAPKKKTLDIIQQAEDYDRGFYTGTAFYYDGKNLDSCVLIRFIENKMKNGIQQLVYKSGGGITVHSEPEKEYQELIDKIYVPTI